MYDYVHLNTVIVYNNNVSIDNNTTNNVHFKWAFIRLSKIWIILNELLCIIIIVSLSLFYNLYVYFVYNNKYYNNVNFDNTRDSVDYGNNVHFKRDNVIKYSEMSLMNIIRNYYYNY